MKKVFYVLALLVVSLTSCDSELVSAPPSDSSENTNGATTNDGILLTKVVIVEANGDIETIEYTYDGMTLIKETSSEGYYSDYVYVDGKLTEINYNATQVEAILESYTYDTQGRVATITTNIVAEGIYEYNLSYNADNSVITETSITFPSDAASTTTLNSGNMIGENEGGVNITTYTHDTKNAPFKNIDNRAILLTINSENGYNYLFNINNILTDVTESTMYPETISNTYTYTAFDYPRVMTENYDGDISTYTYTYNND